MSAANLSDARRAAWVTRRALYGPLGHGKPCYQTHKPRSVIERARDEISVARRNLQMLLPEAAAHKAITALDRADDYLA